MSANDVGSEQNNTFIYQGQEGEDVLCGVIHVRVHPSVRVICGEACL
jgi:hypothetical protein